jgi:nicotinamidase-related amidase
MKSALLVIDVQQGFINEQLKDLPIKIKEFVSAHKFDYIIFFKFLNKQGSNWTKILNWNEMMNLEEASIAPELKQLTNKVNVFIKQASFSIFDNNKFQSFLDNNKIEDLYICGIDTHACVFVSAMDAFAKNYRVKVIEDLCGSSHGEKYHNMAIEILKSNLSTGTVIKSSDYHQS